MIKAHFEESVDHELQATGWHFEQPDMAGYTCQVYKKHKGGSPDAPGAHLTAGSNDVWWNSFQTVTRKESGGSFATLAVQASHYTRLL